MPEIKAILSDESKSTIEQLAREQQREPVEVLDEAVRKYAAFRTLDRLSETLERQAHALGIREEDVPQIVKDMRREKRSRASE